MDDPHRIAAMVTSPAGAAYRGKAGCTNVTCTRMHKPGMESAACYGWHCFYCDGPSNCQGDCSNRECPGKSGV
jgi:hypothetical protein